MTRRVMITGASGLVGRAVFREMKAAEEWEVLGLAYSRAGENLRKVDLTNKDAVTQIVGEFKPDVILHCAAERRPDVVDKQPEATKDLNVQATKSLCEAAASVGAWLLYLSTDYVFDGKDPPYKVTDQPNPLNKYGQSKLDGEQVVQAANKEFGILRIPIMYGEIEYLGESAVTCLFEKVKVTDKPCVMSDYERRYPTHCDDVAYVMREMAEKQLKDKTMSGIFHWSGDENMTKYDMSITMATQFGISTDHIQADKNPAAGAPRPYDAHLDPSRLEQMGVNKRTKFTEGIKNVLTKYYP